MKPDDPQDLPTHPATIYKHARDRIFRLQKGETYRQVYGYDKLKGRLERIDKAIINYARDEKYNTEAALLDDDYELSEIIELKKRLVLAECDKEVRGLYAKELRDIASLVTRYMKKYRDDPIQSGDAYDLVKEMIKLWENNTDQESQRALQEEPSL